MGEKLGFTNCVFEKMCFSENTIFMVFSEKHSSCNKKLHVEKKQKIYEKLWYVLLRFLWFCGWFFVCLVKVQKC